MARVSVSKRTDRTTGELWLVRWRPPGEVTASGKPKQEKESFRRKTDAEDRAREIEASLTRGDYIPPDAGRVTIGEYGAGYVERHAATLKPKSASSMRSLWRSQVKPRWENVRLDAVVYSAVREWVAGMTDDLSASRTRQSYHLLSAILDEAVYDGRLPRNPAAGLADRGGLPKLSASDRRYCTHAEVDSFAAAALAPKDDDTPHPDREALVYVLAYCGPRWGEATAFRVRDFNPLRRRLTVVKAVSDVDGVLVEEDTKDHERRDLPVPKFLAEKLSALVKGRDREALVFPNSRGTWMRNQNVRRDWWDAAAAAAGLGEVTPHELRHTAASLAVSAGANVLAVARMLGHADPSVTLRIYADLFDTDLDNVAKKLDAARRAPRQRPKKAVVDLREKESAV